MNSLKFNKIISKHYYTSEVFQQAHVTGNLLHIIYYDHHLPGGFSWNRNLDIKTAMRYGHVHLLEYSKNKGRSPLNCELTIAASYGQVGVLKWCEKQGIRATGNPIACAITNGHINVLEWYSSFGPILCKSSWMNSACNNGQLRVLKWGLEQTPFVLPTNEGINKVLHYCIDKLPIYYINSVSGREQRLKSIDPFEIRRSNELQLHKVCHRLSKQQEVLLQRTPMIPDNVYLDYDSKNYIGCKNETGCVFVEIIKWWLKLLNFKNNPNMSIFNHVVRETPLNSQQECYFRI